jgi:hypothetical protein
MLIKMRKLGGLKRIVIWLLENFDFQAWTMALSLQISAM